MNIVKDIEKKELEKDPKGKKTGRDFGIMAIFAFIAAYFFFTTNTPWAESVGFGWWIFFAIIFLAAALYYLVFKVIKKSNRGRTNKSYGA